MPSGKAGSELGAAQKIFASVECKHVKVKCAFAIDWPVRGELSTVLLARSSGRIGWRDPCTILLLAPVQKAIR